jgi:hypothetical protein
MNLSLLFKAGEFLFKLGRGVAGVFTGGSLDSILGSIERGMSDEVEKERTKADVVKTWINAQASLLTGRTWWFQLFFVVPLGLYFSSVCFQAAFPMWAWGTGVLPSPMDEWAMYIVSALFIVDGTKAAIGTFKR